MLVRYERPIHLSNFRFSQKEKASKSAEVSALTKREEEFFHSCWWYVIYPFMCSIVTVSAVMLLHLHHVVLNPRVVFLYEKLCNLLI